MFKDDYKAAFSKVTASGETHRRILNMTKEHKKCRSVGGWVSKLLIAAVLVSLLAVSASAAAQNWFVTYFSKESEKPLSQGQVEFVEEHTQDISQKQTCNGYSIELKSVLSDGNNAYVVFGITAPEGVYLDRTVKEGYNPAPPQLWTYGQFIGGSAGATWNVQDDGDGIPNTQNIVYLISSENAFENGKTCEINFENLIAEYENDAYAAELEKKYGYVPKLGELTEEEYAELYPMETLVEGNWNFTITFTKSNVPIVELIDEPVDYVIEFDRPNEHVVQKVKVTSIKLSPIGSQCTFEAVGEVTNGIDGEIYMKDGSIHSLSGDAIGFSSDNYSNGKLSVPKTSKKYSGGMLSVPIALKNVDYVLLPNGIKLPMPELPVK